MPNEQKVTRKLRALLSADVKGYSILMADDEIHTIETLKKYRQIMSNQIQQHSGRVVDNPGDNLLAEFSSAVDAVKCAVRIQNKLKKENARFVEDKRLQFRIGVNIGDVVQDENCIYGSGVNVAARIEGLAGPGGICISRNAYDHVKNKLELGYEYLGEHEVKNIKEPVRVYKVLMDSESPKPLVKESLELPDKPSIAVLPFDNMSGDPSQEYFSDGLTEQIINGLCKVSNLFVIARNSSFAYKGKSISIKQIAQELGVRYILEGSVQRAGDRVRITAQLIDATTGYHLWSENYDRELENIFALQDEITMKLIEALQGELIFGKQAQLWEGRTVNLHAYDKFLRGIEYKDKFNKRDNSQARHLFLDAIKLDNTYDLAYALVSITHVVDLIHGWTQSSLLSFEQADIFVGKALDISDSLDIAHSALSLIYLYKHQYEDAIKEGEQAITLNPNGADAHTMYSWVLLCVGETKEAIRLVKRAIRLNPIPPTFYYFFLGFAYRNDGQHENVIEACKMAINIDPYVIGTYPSLVSSCVLMNRFEDAHTYANELLRISPKFSLGVFRASLPFKEQSDIDAFIESLRKAGLPD